MGKSGAKRNQNNSEAPASASVAKKPKVEKKSSPKRQPKSPKSQPKSPRGQQKSPKAPLKSPKAQPKSPKAQPKSPKAQPKSPKAQPKSPKAQSAPPAPPAPKTLPKRTKPKEVVVDPELKALCDKFAKPEDAMQFLLNDGPVSIETFFKKYWEQTPLLIPGKGPNSDFLKLFSLESVYEYIQNNKDRPLLPHQDYLLTRFLVINGHPTKEDDESGNLTDDILSDGLDNIYGFKFNNPQRFYDGLWAFLEKLECYFASLVAMYAVVAPERVQLMPPHYDDSERFILQVDGTETWTVHNPLVELADEFVCDINENIGEPILTAELKAGDVLYIPRGYVTQSKATSQSTYMVLSTYQKCSVSTMLTQTMNAVIHDLNFKHADFRRGLPLGFMIKQKTLSNSDYAGILEEMAAAIRKDASFHAAPEEMAVHFISHRLPPFGEGPLFTHETLAPPIETDKVTLRNVNHLTWYVKKCVDLPEEEKDTDEEEDAFKLEENKDAKEIFVLSSLSNERVHHMELSARMFGQEPDAFTIDSEYLELLEILADAKEPIAISSLPRRSKTDKIIDPMILLRGLHNLGAIRIHK